MKRRLCVLLVAACVLGATAADALEPWRMVIRMRGKVESRQPGSEWSPIWRSRLLSDGDFARTLDDSRARIRLADSSEMTVGEDTTVEMTQFTLTAEGRLVVFHLQVGRVRARVAKALGKQSKFEVKTPNGVLAARGTEFYVEQTPPGEAPGAGRTYFIVFGGRVDGTTAKDERAFLGGDWGVIDPDGTIHFNPKGVVPGGEGPFSSQGMDADLRSFGAVDGGPPRPPRGIGQPPPMYTPGQLPGATSPTTPTTPADAPPASPTTPTHPTTPTIPTGPNTPTTPPRGSS